MQLSWHLDEELCRVCGVQRKHDKLSIKEKLISCSNPKFVSLRENLEIEVDISFNR